MKRANTLAAALAGAADPELPVPAAEPLPKRRAERASTRHGKHLIAGYFGEGAFKAFKMVAVEEGITQQALLEEAITDLLMKKGRGKFNLNT